MASTVPVSRLMHAPIDAVPKYWRWAAPEPTAGAGDGHVHDTVELSQHARWMHELATLPEQQLQRIARVRAELAAGTYLTEAKLDFAVERLADDVMARLG